MDFHDARTCVIFGAGDYYDETPAIPDDAFVVAADGGLDHARAFGIDADFVVGDFDSITGDRPTQNDRTIALPSEKDDPDLLSALKIGWLRGARTFHIYGALGGRIDHTISNIQLMALLADRGATGLPGTATDRSSPRSATARSISRRTTPLRDAWSPCSPTAISRPA